MNHLALPLALSSCLLFTLRLIYIKHLVAVEVNDRHTLLILEVWLCPGAYIIGCLLAR